MAPSKWIMIIEDLLRQIHPSGHNVNALGSSWSAPDFSELEELQLVDRVFLVATHPRLDADDLNKWKIPLLQAMDPHFDHRYSAQLLQLDLKQPSTIAVRADIMAELIVWEQAWFNWSTRQPDWHQEVARLYVVDQHSGSPIYPTRLYNLCLVEAAQLEDHKTHNQLLRLIIQLGTRIKDVKMILNTVG